MGERLRVVSHVGIFFAWALKKRPIEGKRASCRERWITMLSDDELRDGMPFILQLRNSIGIAFQWMETLRGDMARHWYEIYQSSDWQALRIEASGVFRNAVTEIQMRDFINTETRYISIQTPLVTVEELRR